MVVEPDSNGPSGRGRARRRLALVTAVVVGVLVLAFVLLLVLRGGAEDDNGDTAADVATRYFELEAYPNEPCEYLELVSEDYRDGEVSHADCLQNTDEYEDIYDSDCQDPEPRLSDEQVSGDEASYHFSVEYSELIVDCSITGTIRLVREDGLWKVHEVERDEGEDE